MIDGEKKNFSDDIRRDPYIDSRLMEQAKSQTDNKFNQGPLARKGKYSLDTGTRILAIYVYEDPIVIPKFPEPSLNKKEENVALTNREKHKIILARSKYYFDRGGHRIYNDIKRVSGEILSEAWLINAFLVSVPASQWDPNKYKNIGQPKRGRKLKQGNLLAILSTDLNENSILKGHSTNNSDSAYTNIVDVAAWMGLDIYKEFSSNSAWSIGIIDSGVRANHVAFSCRENIIKQAKFCDNWKTNCKTPSVLDLSSHGTSVASILNSCPYIDQDGRTFLGGATNIPLSSYGFRRKNGNHARWLVIQAIQESILHSDRVINLSQLFTKTGKCTRDQKCVDVVSMAVDAAYMSGSAILVAAGNNVAVSQDDAAISNSNQSVSIYSGSPGAAKLGLSVGSESLCDPKNKHAHGFTSDGRFKPELKVYTCTLSAWAAKETGALEFGRTSGATPFATSAAALLRSWFINNVGQTLDPGLIYAMLLLSGKLYESEDKSAGTYLLELPKTGTLKWGEIDLEHNTEATISIKNIGGETDLSLDVAVWWPEKSSFSQDPLKFASEINIEITKDGKPKASSKIKRSVYQRVGVELKPEKSDKPEVKIHIQGASIPTGTQKVYWAAFLKKRETVPSVDIE